MRKILLLIMTTLFLSSCGIEIVDSGFVGIKRSMGKISVEEYPAGMHTYMPIVSRIFEMSIREQVWEYKTSAYSRDNQIIETTFKVNYRPVRNQVAELFIEKGSNYIDVLLPHRVEAALKDVLGQYRATNLVSSRKAVNTAVLDNLKAKLEGTNIIATNFEIVNFDFDDKFEKAVKDKVIAKEKAVEEKNRTVQVKEQATQRIVRAKAEAQAIREKAKALAKNKDLIQLEAVKKWNGVLPHTMLGGKGAVPFINVKRQ